MESDARSVPRRTGWRDPHVQPGVGARPLGEANRHVGGRGPFEQMPPGHQQSPKRARDRIDGDRRIVKQEDDRQEPAPGMVDEAAQRAAHGAAAASASEAGDKVGKQVGAGNGDRENRPDPGTARQHHPAGCGERDKGDRDKTAAKVVEDLPAVEVRQPARNTPAAPAGHGAAEPRHELPVAAHPTVPAASIFKIACREVFIEDDVARKRAPSLDAFEEVVADQSVLG